MKRHPLFSHVEHYVALRRSQGYNLAVQASLLRDLARFAGLADHHGPLTTDLAVRWAKSSKRAKDPANPWRRLRVVRQFARYLATIEPATQVPPSALLRSGLARPKKRLPLPDRPLTKRIVEYVTLRRRLGYQFGTQGRLLETFARFMADAGHEGPITVDLAVRWAQATRSTDPAQPTRRLQVIRGLAKHLAAIEPGTEVPPAGLLGHPTRRRPPHIYSDAEIDALLRAAGTMRPRHGLRAHTYVAFFSLLLSTGLRCGEARRLRVRDVHLDGGLLTIRETKFGKSRLVPLHPSAVIHLRRYAGRRDRCPHVPRSEFFFRTDHAACLTAVGIDAAFAGLRRRLGWTGDGRARPPRIHDMRHTFVVKRLVRWYAEGVDVDRKMLHLATYLGHVDVSGTYWYLTAVPELMALSATRFEHFVRGGEVRS